MGVIEIQGFLWELVRVYAGLWEYMEVFGSLDKWD